jgi:hypothetical protein
MVDIADIPNIAVEVVVLLMRMMMMTEEEEEEDERSDLVLR